MKIIYPLLAVSGGIAVAMQSSVNGGLGKKGGVVEASFISFLIGTLALFFAVVFFGKGDLLAATTVPKWQFIGGILGAIYILTMVFAVPHIGVAPTLAAVIAGQILMGAIIDHFGWFGGTSIPIDLKKMTAIVLMFISLYLFNQ